MQGFLGNHFLKSIFLLTVSWLVCQQPQGSKIITMFVGKPSEGLTLVTDKKGA